MVGIGIHYLHSQNIVHGDIKGVWKFSTYLLTLSNLYSQSQGNILIDESGQPRLADFGLTIFADGTRHNTTDQGGTLRWMAPELLYPIPGIECYKRTTASDVYAYGCLCIEVTVYGFLKCNSVTWLDCIRYIQVEYHSRMFAAKSWFWRKS